MSYRCMHSYPAALQGVSVVRNQFLAEVLALVIYMAILLAVPLSDVCFVSQH